MPFARILLLSPPYATLTYALPDFFAPEFWVPGLRVAVPLGRGSAGPLRCGVVLETCARADLPEGVVCRDVAWPLETKPLLRADLLAVACELAARQGMEAGRVLGHVLPQGLRSVRVRVRHLAGREGRTLSLRQVLALEAEARGALARKVVNGKARLLPPQADAASGEQCRLRVDPPWPVRPAATRQRAVLDRLYSDGPCTRRHLLRACGDGAGVALAALLRQGLVTLEQDGRDDAEAVDAALMPPPPAPFRLNADQEAAVADLKAALAADTPQSRLLYGVTGSGKTAVYLALAEACLAAGKSVLLLAPEVALAHKLRRDAARALPQATLVFHHGYQTPARREANFRAVASQAGPFLVVGTRSALFLPVPAPGCILLDEEHDASFKQDDGLAYQAKEVAWYRMRLCRGLLVLGSATPDIKTFYAAASGRLPVLRLPHRVGGRALPPVEFVDMRGTPPLFPAKARTAAPADTMAASAAGADSAPQPEAGQGILAAASEDALRETISRGEQAVVLLNRRGYAPLMYCVGCGKTQRCPHCDIGLTYHKGLERLVCHYCGYWRPFPSPCAQCHGMDFLPLGEGTERLAERLAVLAGRPVLRLDRDSARRPGRMEEILAAFARGESPVLVGTQMLSKGHHFPRVTLAVVADGDLGLNLPDYRAAERTFQLLVQSAGRAGRGETPGRVLIQTRDAGHYCWRFVQNGDYEGFYETELALRKKRRYPPFVCLARLRLSFAAGDARGPEALAALAERLRRRARELGVQALGPAPAPLGLLRGRRRFHCLFKAESWPPVRELGALAARCNSAGILRLFLDLDPVNML